MWESSAQAVHLLVKKDIEHHGHGCYTEFYNRILCFLSHHSLKPLATTINPEIFMIIILC